ncbi:MAG: hypothetical protein M5U26_11600 [Planctomycetota bacterium]|nr:hypothetical protein [Planctomycetota bacterium]
MREVALTPCTPERRFKWAQDAIRDILRESGVRGIKAEDKRFLGHLLAKQGDVKSPWAAEGLHDGLERFQDYIKLRVENHYPVNLLGMTLAIKGEDVSIADRVVGFDPRKD